MLHPGLSTSLDDCQWFQETKTESVTFSYMGMIMGAADLSPVVDIGLAVLANSAISATSLSTSPGDSYWFKETQTNPNVILSCGGMIMGVA